MEKKKPSLESTVFCTTVLSEFEKDFVPGILLKLRPIIDLGLIELDHIGIYCESESRYRIVQDFFEEYCSSLSSEKYFSERNIHVFHCTKERARKTRLGTIHTIELSAPKPGSKKVHGFDHIEFVRSKKYSYAKTIEKIKELGISLTYDPKLHHPSWVVDELICGVKIKIAQDSLWKKVKKEMKQDHSVSKVLS